MNWPDITFPPINLYSMPKQWEERYYSLESEYCGDLKEQLEEARGTLDKQFLTTELQTKREEFNRLWNRRAGG